MKNIVVLGAGFAGIRVVRDLAKKLQFFDAFPVKIFLVDKESMHVFTADLYEVATAFNKKITDKCLLELKETVATPIRKLIDSRFVTFINDEVTNIDSGHCVITLKDHKELKYDYLVITLGSETNYFGIKGLKENSLAMKTLQDAVKINCHLDRFFYDLWKKKIIRDVNIIIGGGGATGVETAAELVGDLKLLSRKYSYPREKFFVRLIEGSDKLVGLADKGTEIVLKRFTKLGIKVYLRSFIKEVKKNEIVLKSADSKVCKFDFDILIWTGGVMVNHLIQNIFGEKDCGGAIRVNQSLQSVKASNIFAAGDNAFLDNSGSPGYRLPMLAQVAYQEGALIAENLMNLLQDKSLKKFKPASIEIIVPLGGKYAIWKHGGKIFKGFWVWILRRLVYLKYAMSILPFWQALRKWWHSNDVFVDND